MTVEKVASDTKGGANDGRVRRYGGMEFRNGGRWWWRVAEDAVSVWWNLTARLRGRQHRGWRGRQIRGV